MNRAFRTLWNSRIAWSVGCGLMVLVAVAAVADDETSSVQYDAASHGVARMDGPGGVKIKLLVDKSNLGGGEFELGEITFPATNKKGIPHRHGQVELFYVLSGRLGHTVNGELHVIEPGMVGIVRPEDTVAHSVESDEPVRALVIWAPGGEAERMVSSGIFRSTPLEEE